MIDTNATAPVDDLGILRQAERWARAGSGVAIATVVETFGSAPRPVGSHLIVAESGLFCGSVSAGCVEGEVITAALDVIADGAPRILEFGVADETAWRVGLSCGGRIVVHVGRVDPARLALIARVNAECAARRACALTTPLEGGAARLALSDDSGFADRFRDGSRLVVDCGERVFINCYRPGPRLVIVGAVHVAQALAPMAALAGFDAVVVDPRSAYAAEARFSGARLDSRWPDEALPAIGLDPFTAVAVLTHDPKIDDPALRLALASDCFYVGALGSRATHARRVERLRASGVTPRMLERLRAPIGVDIAAIGPAEIAVAILAELILARGQKPLRSLTPRAEPAFSGACA
ncbi:XdhC family protein [Methylocystis sp. JAN1]|uniref:XdhC family protein n=1 Tax=Methylocystis sp. JAN1 TaxID=3397211 RepID=UPI003FA2D1F8